MNFSRTAFMGSAISCIRLLERTDMEVSGQNNSLMMIVMMTIESPQLGTYPWIQYIRASRILLMLPKNPNCINLS
ncbi:MAG: hypothetical protein BWY82_00363 [Verrucomicrobia bacterium ADurb.Bin474]|nr:MAG: hypothetical protein BWY82_00363 [Verrucomicrobia bacterium ADurb.Bin474]